MREGEPKEGAEKFWGGEALPHRNIRKKTIGKKKKKKKKKPTPPKKKKKTTPHTKEKKNKRKKNEIVETQ